jgi:DNA polymerase elongation subunit (family B)
LLDADECVKESEAGSLLYGLPLIRMFGCTRDGQSLLVLVRDFLPYFFFPVSASFQDQDLAEFLEHCKERVPEVTVVKAEVVKRTPLMYYRPDSGDKYSFFLRITVALPKQIGVLSRYLSTGKIGEAFGKDKYYDTQCYEANLNFLLRFMVDKEMAGGGWLTLLGDKYTPLKNSVVSSRCQINVSCSFEDLIVHPVTDNSKRWSSVAPLRILTLSTFVLLPSESQLSKPQDSTSKRRKLNNSTSGAAKKGKGKGKGKQQASENDSDASDQDNAAGAGEDDDDGELEEGNQEPIAFIANVLNS